MDDLLGRNLLDRYFLRERVGSGGMADVYAAWDNLRSAKLAVKVLRRDLGTRGRFYQMFEKEAELLRKLEHPNIVRLYEFDQDGDIAFLVMDWVEGTNLRQALAQRRAPFALEEVSPILQAVSSALNYAHQNHVYHCDVKPANILLHNDGRVLLTDFGVARIIAEEGGGGTPAYMAPEQFEGERVDERTDVYSLGVTLYEVLTGGELPFRGTNPESVGTTTKERIGWEHANSPVPSPRLFNRELPASVEAVVAMGLAKKKEDRFPTALALRDAYEHARPPARRDRPAASPRAVEKPPGLEKTIILPRLRLPKINVRLEAPRRKGQDPRSSTVATPTRGLGGEPYLLGRGGDVASYRFPVPEAGLSIGRSPHNHVRMRDRSVSRVHARLIRTKRGVYIKDENSASGTYVNGVRISSPTMLKHRDIVQIGLYDQFEFRDR